VPAGCRNIVEDRQDLLAHTSGRIRLHYSQAKLTNLIAAAEKSLRDRVPQGWANLWRCSSEGTLPKLLAPGRPAIRVAATSLRTHSARTTRRFWWLVRKSNTAMQEESATSDGIGVRRIESDMGLSQSVRGSNQRDARATGLILEALAT
jgi:hypothetical protein